MFGRERFWRVLTVLAIVLAGFALGFALVQPRPSAVVQGGFSQQTVTMVNYRVTDGSSRISYGGNSYTVTDGLVSLPYTATWATDMVAAGILERVGSTSAVAYYGDNALRIASGGTADIQSGAVLSISAPIRTDLTASGTLTVVGATALNGGLTMDTNKFAVADTSGNTAIAGTLDVAGDVSSATGAFTVTDSLAVTGTSDFDGAMTVNDDLVVTGTLTLESVAFSGPSRFGSASSAISGTTIAHGLGTTPTAVMLSPAYFGTFTNTVYVLATDATSITAGIGYTTGVTTVTTLYWWAGK